MDLCPIVEHSLWIQGVMLAAKGGDRGGILVGMPPVIHASSRLRSDKVPAASGEGAQVTTSHCPPGTLENLCPPVEHSQLIQGAMLAVKGGDRDGFLVGYAVRHSHYVEVAP
jgi:hypothetical protein